MDEKERAPLPQKRKGSEKSNEPEEQARRAQQAAKPPKAGAVDRPGFDLGGTSEDVRAGSGVGLGPDATEDRRDRSLPGRRSANPLSKRGAGKNKAPETER
jgi:hypothetical protein